MAVKVNQPIIRPGMGGSQVIIRPKSPKRMPLKDPIPQRPKKK